MSNFSKNEATKDKKNQQLRDKRNKIPKDDGAKGNNNNNKKKTSTTTTTKTEQKSSKNVTDKQDTNLGMSRISLDSVLKKSNGNKVNQIRNRGRREEERTKSVTKTKYFPSQKDIIHRVVKEERMKREIKNQLLDDVEENGTKETKREEETQRPRTATLKEASFLQLGPSTSTSNEEQINYEDDFDSYESDFEKDDDSTNINKSLSSISETLATDENSSSTTDDDGGRSSHITIANNRTSSCNNVSKEHKLDSGNFDLQDGSFKKGGQEIVSPVPPPPSSLSDEGYDEDKTVSKMPYGYDFERTRIDEQKCRLNYKKSRGEEIQKMIKFNKCYYTTFEIVPVPYEQFIQIHGQTLGIQCAVQTASTSNINENVQTEEIVGVTKWTQIPAVFSTTKQQNPNWENYKQEFLGVGSDSKPEQIQQEQVPHYRSEKFINSLNNSATIVLSVLNNENNKHFYTNTKENEAGSIKTCAQDFDFLRDTSVIDLYTSNSNNFLTIHLTNSKKFTEASYICVWNAATLQQPFALLRTLGRPTCANFGNEHVNYVFVGFKDGTLSLWDTNEESSNEKYRFISSPSFKTKISESHQTTITSVLCALKNVHLEESVYSLDEEGLVIFWTTVTKKHPKRTISLVQNSQLNLKTLCSNLYYGMEFKRLCFNPLDPNHLFILSNSDKILHCYSTGSKIYPKHYKTDELSIVTSIDCCPFSSRYFIVGYENGKVALFSRNVQRSLMILSNEGNGKRARIDTVQWSSEKPCIFYAKDDKNVLHVWNLALSDIFPIYSIPFKENVISIKVTTPKKKHKIYMIIATKDGQLSVHFLNNEHKSLTNEEYDTDVKYFLNYVKRL